MKDSEQIKLRKKFIKLGVKMLGPETIFFSKDTKIGKNVTIEPYVVIGSKVKIGNNVIIKSGAVSTNVPSKSNKIVNFCFILKVF